MKKIRAILSLLVLATIPLTNFIVSQNNDISIIKIKRRKSEGLFRRMSINHFISGNHSTSYQFTDGDSDWEHMIHTISGFSLPFTSESNIDIIHVQTQFITDQDNVYVNNSVDSSIAVGFTKYYGYQGDHGGNINMVFPTTSSETNRQPQLYTSCYSTQFADEIYKGFYDSYLDNGVSFSFDFSSRNGAPAVQIGITDNNNSSEPYSYSISNSKNNDVTDDSDYEYGSTFNLKANSEEIQKCTLNSYFILEVDKTGNSFESDIVSFQLSATFSVMKKTWFWFTRNQVKSSPYNELKWTFYAMQNVRDNRVEQKHR